MWRKVVALLKIIPFFDKYLLVGAKRQDYLDLKPYGLSCKLNNESF
jgi:hypothetical protein